MNRSQFQETSGRRIRRRRAGGQLARAALFGGVVASKRLGGLDFLDDRFVCRRDGFGGLEGEEAEEGQFGVGGCGGHFERRDGAGFYGSLKGVDASDLERMKAGV